MGVARVDKHEDNRRKKKQEIVENFKRLFPGVFDRLINMSNPIRKKYNVAITKQLGRYMEAIVVDTEQTARQCIQYLKDQMLEPETFLPLDYIQAKPLKERLRNISNPRGVKLLYDVLQYEPSDIKRAVLFVTNNSLVCETPEDAMKVAYEMVDGQRYDAMMGHFTRSRELFEFKDFTFAGDTEVRLESGVTTCPRPVRRSGSPSCARGPTPAGPWSRWSSPSSSIEGTPYTSTSYQTSRLGAS